MRPKIYDQIEVSLVEKRQTLDHWQDETPPVKRQSYFGEAGETALQDHIHVIAESLEKTSDGRLGLCEVCHGYVDTQLLEMDYTACVCLDHFSDSERRNLEVELELAANVQQSLLPQQAPDTAELEYSAFTRPAQFVSGDYFDFFEFRDGAQGVAIADVAGHGISASLHMASLQTLLRTLTPLHALPCEVVRQVDHLLIHNIRFTTFVSLFLGAFDSATHAFTFCNAGHPPPLLYRARSREPIQWLRSTGAAIGLIEDATFKDNTVILERGDVLLFYTDGVTEATDVQDQQFGLERLASFLQAGADRSARELVLGLRDALLAFTGDKTLEDDITVLACRVIY
jgi:sigma-B regulation protein RsbU (phosphoserine phosphatase)